jgi:hypothetical protein
MLVATFTKELSYGRLQAHEQEKLQARGEAVLKEYYKLEKDVFTGDVIVEANFKEQGVVIDGAHITGKIDQMIPLSSKEFSVIDLKTGKGFSSFTEGKFTQYDEIKLHHYKTQLLMYKILVEHSRDYENYSVSTGVLEFVEEVEHNAIQKVALSFDTQESKEALGRTKKLASSIYKKIINLDFPDTEMYEKNLKGILAFEEDLLKGTV